MGKQKRRLEVLLMEETSEELKLRIEGALEGYRHWLLTPETKEKIRNDISAIVGHHFSVSVVELIDDTDQ